MKLTFPKIRIPKFKLRFEVVEGLIHTLFAGFFLILLGAENEKQFMIFCVLATVFFSHALILIPQIFKKAFFNYATSVATISIMVLVFGMLTDGAPQEVIPIIILILIVSGGYGTIRWFILNSLKNYAFTAETKTAELKLLKSQINPHFIFNSLNVIYATALEENSSKTAESIAKMSNLIRYMLEDNTQEYISVHKEVKYLKDYIKLQLMRSSVEHDIEIHIDINRDVKIAPMLLIPFVENAFKHGINPNQESTLYLNFISNEYKTYFQLINSVDDDYHPSEFEKGFGMGIENVEKRLELIYPKKHKLQVDQEEQVFSVELEVNHK